MNKRYLVALDQGTTSSRAVVFTIEGRMIGSAAQEFPQHYPNPGWVEHDPGDILSTQIESLRAAVRNTGIDPAEYTNTLFGMYAGERRSIRLRFADSMAGVVIDRFGKDAILIPDGADHFTVRVDVSVSPQFLAWVFGLGANAEILDPPDVRSRMRAYLAEIQKIYE